MFSLRQIFGKIITILENISKQTLTKNIKYVKII